MNNEEQILQHESFGQISFSRINGRNRFYGSELQQDNYIEMKVYHSEVKRTLTKDWYYTKSNKPIIKLRMSAGQFSEMITNMNTGNGVPCTLERIEDKILEQLPEQESRKEFVHNEFNSRMRSFAKTIREKQLKARELVNKKILSKQDMHNLNTHIEWLSQEISSNIPFFMECFQETMDTVVHEAKLEVENAIQHKINVLGLEKLHEQNKLLNK